MINSKAASIAFVNKSLPLSEYNGIKKAEKDSSFKDLVDMEKYHSWFIFTIRQVIFKYI